MAKWQDLTSSSTNSNYEINERKKYIKIVLEDDTKLKVYRNQWLIKSDFRKSLLRSTQENLNNGPKCCCHLNYNEVNKLIKI